MSPYYANLRQQVGQSLVLMPAVAGMVHDADGRLLLQRKDDGSWSLPAGAIEPGETPKEAMIRELHEETGLRPDTLTLVNCFGGEEFRHTYPNGHLVEYIVLLFRCDNCSRDAITVDPETVELRYFSAAEFPGLALPYPLDALYAS